jgi:hypothetical protein
MDHVPRTTRTHRSATGYGQGAQRDRCWRLAARRTHGRSVVPARTTTTDVSVVLLRCRLVSGSARRQDRHRGYPWFTDWGRDTFISLRGLCLATGRLEEAGSILGEWAGAVSEGMLPNPSPTEKFPNSLGRRFALVSRRSARVLRGGPGRRVTRDDTCSRLRDPRATRGTRTASGHRGPAAGERPASS